MKKNLKHLCLIALLFTFSAGFAQQEKTDPAKKGINDQFDPRVDNMHYWMEKAEQGLVPYNPNVQIPPAIFRGSQIKAQGIRSLTSPDIPVTNLTNVTESENSVFIDPNNADFILNSNNSTSWTGTSYGTLYGASYFQSSNAGIGWVGSPNGAGGSNSGDPTTAISLTGRQYINFIDASSGQGIAYSDNGTTWSTSTIATNPGSLADKNHMWIDNSNSSSYKGNLYTAWTDFGGTYNYQVLLSRSTNNGVTWSAKMPISGSIASFNHGVNLQTGPAGQVYAIWATYPSSGLTEDGIGFNKSLNGGVTFGTATKIISNIMGIRGTGVLKNMRVNSFPVMAVDISGGPNNGNIYVVWTNIGVPGTNTGTNKSIYMIRSTDGGTSWSTPIRINKGPFADGKEAYAPWICCDPVTGALSVVFYDDRNVSSTQCETFAAYSYNAGNTWTDFVVSDVAFTPVAIPGLASGYMGDYLGITSRNSKVYPCWTDNRGGIYMTYVSPFYLGLSADFGITNSLICTGSGTTFTDVSTGPPTSWTWSFPGGNPASYVGQTPPTITYSTSGSYTVSLTVSDGVTTDTKTKTGCVTVQNVIADFTATPTTVVVGNSVTFSDNSSCTPATWVWSFPGGTPASYTGQTPPPIVYSTLGTYDVSLTVTKPGASDTKTKVGYITVAPPVFNIASGSITTCTGDFYDTGGPNGNYQNNETIVETFYPSTTGSMIRFAFSSFSTESGYDTLTIYNGINSSAAVIGKYHGTTSPGTITASNASGALTFRFHSDVSVVSSGWAATISCYSNTSPPVADFSASSTIPMTGETVTFTDLTTNYPASWAWSFSPATIAYTGGTSATSQNPQVQFLAAGPYSVTLTATNAFGSNAKIKTNYINVPNCTISTFPWTEGFENGGVIPTCWTQEQVNSSGVDWTFVTGNGGSNPAAAHGGTKNACLKDASSADNKTRLITPSLNLTLVSSPQLKFWHTQQFWSPDQDQLTVFYRTSANGTWTQLSTYTASITTWTQEIILLPSPSSTYYIAFEGNAKYGYGVCVDDVEVSTSCTSTVPVSLSISASTNPVCAGTAVVFTATPTNGGTLPAYQWKVNGTNVSGATGVSYNYSPVNNDLVTCTLTSSIACVTGNPATSGTITMVVNPVLPVSVSIGASANPVDAGTLVTFTATGVNPGLSPVYHWKVNGIDAGTNSNSYAYVPVDGDQVTCALNSNAVCVSGNPATSNTVTMTVNSVSVIRNINDITVSGTQCFDATQTIIVAGNSTIFSVTAGANATMIAGQNILFYPGTSVSPGGYLHGYIAPGGPFCGAPTVASNSMGTTEKTLIPEQHFFRVYPNPTKDLFTLALNGYVPSDKISVEIYNMKGEKIISTEILNEMKHEFSLAGNSSGLYLVKVISGTMSGTSRIVKQ